ncbi:MAG TPA: nuclease [Planctomycetota bacterium]|nr:nuclease [Planctomycetota bacterium]
MLEILKIPPESKLALTLPEKLVARFRSLIGVEFPLTFKTRTDGSNVRKLIANTLADDPNALPLPCAIDGFKIVPPKSKGVPRIRLEFIDTYIVTSGDLYNLQVWNRNPASPSVQIEFGDGSHLLASDVRFVLVRVDTVMQRIRSVFILTPDYIVDRFGPFGKPTKKQQLIIPPKARERILSASPPLIFHSDLPAIKDLISSNADLATSRIASAPTKGELLSLESLRNLLADSLIGLRIESGATRTKGQLLESTVASMLGYPKQEFLAGGYPDIRHQALEVKLQDSPTIDLGMHSPQFEETIPTCAPFTTESMRYLIALTNDAKNCIAGVVLSPGAYLGSYFTFVAASSFKSQRTIPMKFFDAYDGKVVFNPRWP